MWCLRDKGALRSLVMVIGAGAWKFTCGFLTEFAPFTRTNPVSNILLIARVLISLICARTRHILVIRPHSGLHPKGKLRQFTSPFKDRIILLHSCRAVGFSQQVGVFVLVYGLIKNFEAKVTHKIVCVGCGRKLASLCWLSALFSAESGSLISFLALLWLVGLWAYGFFFGHLFLQKLLLLSR